MVGDSRPGLTQRGVFSGHRGGAGSLPMCGTLLLGWGKVFCKIGGWVAQGRAVSGWRGGASRL